jgi:hypothetical protein
MRNATMPSGYTADVQSGKVTDFREYAMQCARAFGSTILMRDDPLDKAIPEKFEPSTYHEESIARARTELSRLKALSPEEIAAECKAANAEAARSYFARKAETRQQRERYEAMLEKARAYVPPSVDHEGYAKFLVTQLEESIRFDCHEYEEPVFMTTDDWLAQRIASTERNIAYHTEQHAEEVERTEGRNRWIAQLRESLNAEAVNAG